MTKIDHPRPIRNANGRVHVWVPDSRGMLGGKVLTEIVPLLRLDSEGPGRGRLWGQHVRVRNAGTIHVPGALSGDVGAVPIGDAEPNSDGDWLFEPSRGGCRIDKFTLRSEKYRQRYVEAAHFGEVNTYYHVDRIAEYVDELLGELQAPSLPILVVVVNAHPASTPRADGTRDGVLRGDRWLPFQGGHYRLPARNHGIAEFDPISPAGEIHLGPGWQTLEHGALVESAGGRYRQNASHIAGTIYHEFGHHITRHTADFLANELRDPDKQSNLKTDLDEGFCDYFAAAMLVSPHIWGWHRRHDEQEVHGRSLVSTRTMADFDSSKEGDPHANGTIWAAAFWDLRKLLSEARPDGARACDKLALQTLLVIGARVGDELPIRQRTVRRARARFENGLSALLEADAMLHGGRHREDILRCFASRGISPDGTNPRPHSDDAAAALSPDAARSAATTISARQRTVVGPKTVKSELAELAEARAHLLRHVPADHIAESEDLFTGPALEERMRALDEPWFSVIATGDTMLGGRTTPVIANFGLEHPFKALRPLLRRSHVVLGNLEGPLARQAKKQERNFSYRVSPRMAVSLKRAGFNVMTLANNHLMDCGRQGVLETLEALKASSIAPLGAGPDERTAHSAVVLQAGALRIGLLGYYWNRRTAARAQLPGSAMDTRNELEHDIGHLRMQVDRIVVTFHWGVPYEREPSSEDRAKARFAVECGADAVIGHHPHVIQPFEIHCDRPIFYSVGNFAFGSANSRGEGLLVGLRFEEARTQVHVHPLYVKNRDPRVNYQPKALKGRSALAALHRLEQSSGIQSTALRIEDFRGVLDLPWTARVPPTKRELSRPS